MQQLQAFGIDRAGEQAHACDVPAGPVDAGDKAGLDRIAAVEKHDRYGRGGGLCRQCSDIAADGCDDCDLAMNKIRREDRQSVRMALGPAKLDCHVLAVDKAGFLQALAERLGFLGIWGSTVKKPDHRQRRLLRAGGERPRGYRAAKERDELAPSHSITSSARDAKVGDIDKPIAFAALRFITIWYFVGAWIGRSLGFSPWRIRLA